MKNKILIAGVLLFAGGFMLADASGLDLLANIASSSSRGDERRAIRASVTPFPGTTAEACRDGFKKAEDVYKKEIRAAKDKRDLAVHAKNLCIQKVNETRRPSPTPTSTSRVR